MTEKMKYISAFIPAWGLYYAGDLASKIMNKWGMDWLFIVYSVCMQWSLFFSDWGNIGVWLDADE